MDVVYDTQVRKKQTKTITFIDVKGLNIPKPTPAIEALPDWYKNTASYSYHPPFPLQGGDVTAATIKKCIPVLDALSAGYILVTHADLQVTREDNFNIYHWRGDPLIDLQARRQAPEHPQVDHPQDIPKFLNPWGIKTPLGYSCLFIPPLHRETPIQIMPGVVDTDTYHAQVNLPFTLKTNWFEGLIPAGTPIAQIIPFKRDEWRSELSINDEMSRLSYAHARRVVSMFYNAYKDIFWNRKTYR